MYHDAETVEPRLGVHGSIAVEIDWALSAAHRSSKSTPSVLEALYRDDPDLAHRVRTLWGPGETLTYPGYLELSVLAWAGGLLFSLDAEEFLSRLGELARSLPEDLPLESEKPEDRMALLRRLHVLRTSAKRRAAYTDVVREVWSRVAPAWASEGRRAVESAVHDREVLIAKDPDWRDFLRAESDHFDHVDRLAAGLGPGGEVAIVPAFLTYKGLVVDLPGYVVVGVRAESSAALARARTEVLARRLKAISDPTRLAMLDALSRSEMTVTQIAEAFSLAQPTVSNHIKVLREAGVIDRGDGRTKPLTIRSGVVNEILDELRGVLGDTARD